MEGKTRTNNEQSDKQYRVLGLMSGSSLDGIDWCMASFNYKNGSWSFQMEGCGVQDYSPEMVGRLTNAHLLTVNEAMLLQADFGKLSTIAAEEAVGRCGRPELIAEHGHTLIHRPELGYTWQMSAAPMLATRMRLPVVSDFRRVDVALGGQGAPLVPYGDGLLFSQYTACLNLGGIANLSFERNGVRLGFDVCFANQVLNQLAQNLGLPIDAGGAIASMARHSADSTKSARVARVLSDWASINFSRPIPPPSLSRESLQTNIMPLFESAQLSTEDALWAWCQHIAQCVENYLQIYQVRGKILITGGGAFNRFLVDCLTETASTHPEWEWEVGSNALITHKEALLFGFFGLLRYLGLPNVDASYTGSSSSHSAGCIYEPFPKSPTFDPNPPAH